MTTSALTAEVQHDPLVRKRYERQFLMSEGELIHYFSSLHIEALKEDRRYLVFNVDDSLVIRSRMLHLTKGTLVFADADHKPILKCSCGNPMSAALPAVGENDALIHSLAGGLVAFTRSAENPGDNQPLVADNNIMMTGEVPSLDETPEIEPPGSRPEPLVPTPTPVPVPIPGVPPIGWLPLIPLIPLIPIIDHNPPGGPNTPLAAPEPASFAPLGLGVVALAWKRRKK